MIFGITLNKLDRIKANPNAKINLFTRWQFSRSKIKRYKFVKLKELTLNELVDCEIFIENEQFKEFCTIFVKRKWWQTIYLHELESIVTDYARQKTELIEENDFIFNPPQYGEIEKETTGTELRREFVARFGIWVNVADTVCKGYRVNPKEVGEWSVNDVLFWANYLKGQRIVENVK